MSIYNSIVRFISSLSTFDIIFFCAIILLIILVIAMLYIVDQNEAAQFQVLERKPESNLEPDINYEKIAEDTSSMNDNLDLSEVTKALGEASPINIDMNKYEIEQEEKAIISYEELLENTGSFKMNYEDEQEQDGISVKKVDLSNIATIDHDLPLDNEKVQVISYAKEEAFLIALKQLQQQLN